MPPFGLRFKIKTMMIAIAVVAFIFTTVHESWQRWQESQRVSRRIGIREKLLKKIGESNNAWSFDWHEKHVLKPNHITFEDLKRAEDELVRVREEMLKSEEMLPPGKLP